MSACAQTTAGKTQSDKRVLSLRKGSAGLEPGKGMQLFFSVHTLLVCLSALSHPCITYSKYKMLSKIFLDISKKTKTNPVLTTEHWLHPIQWCELKTHGISFQLNLFLVALGFSRESHSCCRAWAPEHVGSGVAACRLSCLTACELLVLWPGIEPTSSALQGRCLTTGPQGKSLNLTILEHPHYSRSLRYKNWGQPLPSRSSESKRKAGIHNAGQGAHKTRCWRVIMTPEFLRWNSAQSLPLIGVRDSNLLNLTCDYKGLSSALLSIFEFIKVPEKGISVIFVIRGRKKKNTTPQNQCPESKISS